MSAFLLVWAGCAFPMEEWVLNSCTAMVPDVVHLVRSLLVAAARHKFHINCSAPGYFGSRVPNAFSPFHWQAFHQLSLNGDRQPTVISLPEMTRPGEGLPCPGGPGGPGVGFCCAIAFVFAIAAYCLATVCLLWLVILLELQQNLFFI